MGTGLLSLPVITEIGVICLAGFILFRRSGYPLAEAVTCAIITTLMTLSCLIQAVFLLGVPTLLIPAEVILVVAAMWVISRHRATLVEAGQIVRRFMAAHPVVATVLLVAWGYMALQALLLPPHNWDSMSAYLTRVLLFQQEKSLFLKNVTGYHQATFPVGSDILPHLFLRFYTDYGVILFNFLAYLAIACGVYALARHYGSIPEALCATFVVVSMPGLVYPAVSTKSDMMVAAVAIFCLLIGHHLIKQPHIQSILLLIYGILFGVSAKTTFIAFALSFIFFFGILLIRTHGWGLWPTVVIKHWKIVALASPPMMITSQIWLFVHNYFYWGGWSGPPDFVAAHSNRDGVWGALANLSRYFVQSAHFLRPVDILFERVTGYWLTAIFQQIYDRTLEQPLWRGAGALYPFILEWPPLEEYSWFGPLGFLLILPAIGYALWRGTAPLRALALTLLGFAFVVAWQVPWMPWNGRFFILFFVGGGVCLAYLLQNWPIPRRAIPLIYLSAGLILAFGVIANNAKPLLPIYRYPNESVWTGTAWGQDRLYYARNHFGDDRVAQFAATIPRNAQVGLIAGSTSWIYHYLLTRPDVTFVILNQFDPATQQSKLRELDYLLCVTLDCHPLAQSSPTATLIWQAGGQAKQEGALYRLQPE
jgi:hypothetical protein